MGPRRITPSATSPIKNLSGRVALVTGGASRIGAGIASKLHGCGMNVAIHCKSSVKNGEKLVDQLNLVRPASALLLQADLLDFDRVGKLVADTLEQFQRLDAIVNNASVFYSTRIENVSGDEMDEMLGVHIKAPLALIQAGCAELRNNRGSIVNITDLYAQHNLANYSAYCASKAGLEAITRSLAVELAPEVRVNAIAPGAILWNKGSTQQDSIIARTPLQRTGTVEEIADCVVYLIRDATFTTGQILTIDGGRSLTER